MESQLCNEPGETSVRTAQGNGLPAHPENPSFARQDTLYASLLLVKRIRNLWSRDERRTTRNEPRGIKPDFSNKSYSIAYALPSSKDPRTNSECFFLLVFFSIFYRTLCPGFGSTGQGSHPDYDPVNVRSAVREIAYLQGKLQATHDEGEQCALEEDITGKILWFYWHGIRSEVDQLLPKVVDCIRNGADEHYHYRTGLRQIAEIIERAPREIPDDDIVHLRR
ncbi:hypothetical protein EDC04DRAFT_525292 [Pisolithus marmoratus]|nr:hypothetical protein EDC04DRAFT_525292 [Pisolithus marmoratus]